jgi:hypothetical protein
MRIISSFRDYYDCIQAQGQDMTRIYLREEKSVKLKPCYGVMPHFSFSCYFGGYDTVYIYEVLIGFCGKIYPILYLSKMSMRDYNATLKLDNATLCQKPAQVDEWVNKNLEHRSRAAYFNKRGLLGTFTQRNIRNEFAKCVMGKHWDEHFAVAPIFRHFPSYHNKQDIIIYNIRLNAIGFQKIIDPYTAFQELSMWINNIALPEKEIPKIDDKTMAEAKGFDKFSFRKSKSKGN